jgi:outer membrane receptor protein involved in Fe transport
MSRPFRPSAHRVVALCAILAAAPVLVASTISAQESPSPAPKGKVGGRVVDARTGQGLTDVGVQLVGTTIGAQTALDGRFTIVNVPAGTITIQVRRLGYQPKTVTGLMLPANGALEQVVTMEPATVQLSEQVVTAAAERGTVSEALDQQRTATGIVNAVTAEQIRRSPDSDAAQAVQRVSGVTVQDGKYVFVRGLGERYTTTSLNGARIPSPEPEKKVVPLDLFPTGLLQTITTSKTFTPDQQGDFSGAQVDIQTREFPARRVITYSSSVGFNDAAAGARVLRAPSSGSEWLGLAGNNRDLPGLLLQAGDFQGLRQSDYNQLARSLRNSWSPTTAADGSPNYSMSASLGGQDPILGHPVGYIISSAYSTQQEVRANEHRATSLDGGTEGTRAINVFEGSTGRRSVLWGGLVNLSTMLGTRSRIAFNNTYNRTADNEARIDSGTYEPLGSEIRRTTLRYIERSIRSSQLKGEHAIGDVQNLDWSVTSSGVTRREPDRSDLIFVRETDPVSGQVLPFALLESSNDAARRTYGDLDERGTSADVSYRLRLGSPNRPTLLKVGGFYRDARRDAENHQYALRLQPSRLTHAERALPAELLFDGRYAQDTSTVFDMRRVSSGGSYGATDNVAAGFAMADVPLGDRIRLVGGARYEHARLRVRSEQTSGQDTTARLGNDDVLPSLALNIKLGGLQNLRISASQTLSRPEYRELSPVTYVEVLGGEVLFGNANLRRSLIQNYDARWEWYPNAGEVLSLGIFAKRFRDPIERVDVATSGQPQVTFVNAEAANNYGIEIELRKGLGMLAERLAPLTMFSNATVMKSEITIGNDAVASKTNDSRSMVGQAPYVLNAGVTYTSSSGRGSATVLFNRVGERIVAAGVNPLPDSYEQPRNVVDLSVRLPLFADITARLDAKNVLDAPYVLRQGAVTRERYTSGRTFGLGLTWQP